MLNAESSALARSRAGGPSSSSQHSETGVKGFWSDGTLYALLTGSLLALSWWSYFVFTTFYRIHQVGGSSPFPQDHLPSRESTPPQDYPCPPNLLRREAGAARTPLPRADALPR